MVPPLIIIDDEQVLVLDRAEAFELNIDVVR